MAISPGWSVAALSVAIIASVILLKSYPDSSQRPLAEDRPPIADKPSISDQFAAKPKPPSDHKSCAIFLNDIKSLTLDDFEPIDNQKVEELTLSQISQFNNLQLGPRIQSIARMDYFKFVKLNLHRGCIYWPDTFKCVLKYATNTANL